CLAHARPHRRRRRVVELPAGLGLHAGHGARLLPLRQLAPGKDDEAAARAGVDPGFGRAGGGRPGAGVNIMGRLYRESYPCICRYTLIAIYFARYPATDHPWIHTATRSIPALASVHPN